MKKKKRKYYEGKKSTLTVYLILRFFVILSLILQAIHHNWNNVFLCFLTLILMLIPNFVDKKLKIELPSALEIIILIFIFAAEMLGELQSFYTVFKHFDTVMHTINGFLCAAIGFSLIDILNRQDSLNFKLSPVFVAVVAFCFSMTIGVLWEFFEYGMDMAFKTDMQKDFYVNTISSVKFNPDGLNETVVIDNIDHTVIYSYKDNKMVETVINEGYLDIGIIDTMKDLLVNFIGAVCFSIIGYLYIKDRDEYKFAKNFIPKLKPDIE